MSKIDPNKKCCEEYTRQPGNQIKEDICASCHFNLFAHCWKEGEDLNDPVIIRALQGNDEAKQQVHDFLENPHKYAGKATIISKELRRCEE